MCKQAEQVTFSLPSWLQDYIAQAKPMVGDKAKMAFVLGAIQKHLKEGTGGPFGAAVFDMTSGDLVSLGLNLVVPANLSMLHAEVVAISLAQQKLASHDLAAVGSFELISSTEPCAMCLGAVHWSGVKRLVCGARDEDARSIGFDEGVKHPDWQKEFEALGIQVETDVCREEAANILKDYSNSGALIYNSSALS